MSDEKLKNWTLEEKQLIHKYVQKKGVYEKEFKKYDIKKVIDKLKKHNYLQPIHHGDYLTYASVLYQEKLEEMESLEYDPLYCCRLKADRKNFEKKYKYVFFADWESSTDGTHSEYCICFIRSDGKCRCQIFGRDCVTNFLERIPSNCLVYFHNLSYDINFIVNKLDEVYSPIIKNGRTMSLNGIYKKKKIVFKDSYSIISSRLKEFPRMFKLESGEKEVFPYQYYSSELLKNGNKIGVIDEALEHIPIGLKDQFVENIDKIKGCRVDRNRFRLDSYSNFYCHQDVRILQLGFEKFREDLLREFGLDVYQFISISSIANKLLEREVYNKNCNVYELANAPREFISRCVLGGRCMIRDNQKIEVNDKIVDFDAVSLYPSAMNRLYVLEGIPIVLSPEMLEVQYLKSHLFEEDQTDPTEDRFISGLFIEIEITKIGIERHFPLINDGEGYHNKLCHMYVDHITLIDLIEFQGIECNVIRGYYYKEKRDLSIRSVVQNLFDLRLKYKNEGNPAQEIIKLLLNSIYGKTILKPIETKVKLINKEKSDQYVYRNYNSIDKIEEVFGSKFVKVDEYKNINKHYNLVHLGVNILSMSKRIMNEVMCLAEDNSIEMYYQDTDSQHLKKDDIPKLSELYKNKFGRELIGKKLGQFHSDFPTMDGSESYSEKSIFCGKKIYMDKLTNQNGCSGFMARMKGITSDVIGITANKLYPDLEPVEYKNNLFYPKWGIDKASLEQLFEDLFAGKTIEFDLCDSASPSFEMRSNYSITTKSSFIRKINCG
jgi:hypothetical protein